MVKNLGIYFLPIFLLLILGESGVNANLKCYYCNGCEEGFPFAEVTCKESDTSCLKTSEFKSIQDKNDGNVSFIYRGCSKFELGCHEDNTTVGIIRTRCGCDGEFCNGSDTILGIMPVLLTVISCGLCLTYL